MVPLQNLRPFQGKAIFAAKNIWRKIRRAKVPQFVKPFLALELSLHRNVARIRELLMRLRVIPEKSPSDPIPHLA